MKGAYIVIMILMKKVYPAEVSINRSDHCRINNRICTHGHTRLFFDMAIFFKADELSNWTCISR
ncbi:hypothetical protein DS62_11265 [Smithella sp. SC_K08D17]|jgi:hypothetical protein|nr:hypothetical protein KD27_06760 [Smithella sp. D17]KIE18389.1 hypothetical protein DS62_11265 [Smithella sp. SC_K08D17]